MHKIIKGTDDDGNNSGFLGNFFASFKDQSNISMTERLISGFRYVRVLQKLFYKKAKHIFDNYPKIINHICFNACRSTLHLFDHPNVSLLFDHIRDGNNSTMNGFKNYYLIHVPESYANNSKAISKYFTDVPLKFNSLTFAFSIEMVEGTKIIKIANFLVQSYIDINALGL